MKKALFWSLLIAGSLFLYTYNIHETTVFIADVARDTLRSLEIWKHKELTLIGPPASFGQSGTRNIFFGSMSLYAGAFGLVIGRFDPVAANIFPILLFLVSIPFAYAFFKEIFKSDCFGRAGAVLFALSPLTLTHARFFWNANFLIPLSVFFWWALVKRKPIIGGLIAGVMINAHYVSVYLVIGYVIWALVKKRHHDFGWFVFGVLISSSPLFIFEMRNDFYLTHAIMFNLQHGVGGGSLAAIGGLIKSILLAPFVFMGLFSGEIAFPHLFPFVDRFAGATIRYLFPVYVWIIWIVLRVIHSENRRIGTYMIGAFMLVISIQTLTGAPAENQAYIPLSTIEKATQKIVQDNPQKPYNISENIIGDARGMSFRYFLLRDAQVQPENPETYGGLDALYVISPDKNKIYKEKRWEFTATPELVFEKEIPVNEVSVFVFKRSIQ